MPLILYSYATRMAPEVKAWLADHARFHCQFTPTSASRLKLVKRFCAGDITEQSLTGLLGLEYHLNREVTLFRRYAHVDFDSTDISRNYNYDEFKVGVRR